MTAITLLLRNMRTHFSYVSSLVFPSFFFPFSFLVSVVRGTSVLRLDMNASFKRLRADHTYLCVEVLCHYEELPSGDGSDTRIGARGVFF